MGFKDVGPGRAITRNSPSLPQTKLLGFSREGILVRSTYPQEQTGREANDLRLPAGFQPFTGLACNETAW